MQNSSTKQRPSLLIAFLLFVIPLIAYCSQLGRWGIDCDEFYTYFDSSLPIAKLLEWETKPIYYIVCHFLLKLDLGLPLEVVLRLPSAICSSLIPVTAYWMLWSPERNRMALFTALLFLINPWIFGFAVTARFYGVVTWLSLIAIVALWRWIETSRTSWICTFGIVTLIATGVHTTAGVLFPAGAIAAVAASMSQDPKLLWQRMRAWAPIFAVVSLLMLGSAYWVLHKQIDYWLTSDSGTFGSYSILQIAVAVLLNVGITVFSLAVLPLIRPLRSWNAEDIFLTVIVVSGVLPFLALVMVDAGGVSPRYLLPGLTAVFVLAGKHWAQMDAGLSQLWLRITLGVAIAAFNLPYLASQIADGGHFDYRSAAGYIEANADTDAILIASGHLILEHFLQRDTEVEELTEFNAGLPRPRLSKLIAVAESESRQLFIVSRESRRQLSPDEQAWLYDRFALVRSFETKRFDHRSHRMVIYQFRPASSFSSDSQSSQEALTIRSTTSRSADMQQVSEQQQAESGSIPSDELDSVNTHEVSIAP